MYLIRERFLAIGDDFDVLDEHGTKLFHVDGKVFTLHDRVVIENPDGDEVASVHRHLISLRPTYEIRIGGEKAAEVRKHLFTPFRDKFTIDVPVPGRQYTFGVVKAAQARGDFGVLVERDRRALRVHLGANVAAGLATLQQAITQALA